MNNPIRVFFFRHYWWLSVVISLGIGWAIVVASRPENIPGNLVALCAAALGVIYFVQKQKVDDLLVFERLFTQFNQRYADLHERLQRTATAADGELTDREVLDAYFNLCAEEFLFYQQGRILPSVWQAWCRGMQTHLNSPRVASYWASEQTVDSHYGLTIGAIRAGAG